VKIRSTQLSIILGFTLLIFITILTIGALSFYLFNNTLRKNSLDNTSQVITQLNRVIDNYISYLNDISLVVVNNNDVRNYISETFDEKALQVLDTTPIIQMAEKEKVTFLFQSIISVRKDIDSIILLLDNRTIVTDHPNDQINPYAEWPSADTFPVTAGLPSASLSSSHVQNLIAGE
jgi:two-component system sensor histidine kinase YesM